MAVAQVPHDPARPGWKRTRVLVAVVVVALALVAGLAYALRQGNSAPSSNPATRAYHLAGMTITVPGEWTRVDQSTPRGITMLYLADPQHDPGGMTFSVASAPYQGSLRALATQGWSEVNSNPMFSHVKFRIAQLPAGQAFRLESIVTKDSRTFTDLKYTLVAGRRAYIVTFLGLPALMRSHAPQITTAVNSITFGG